MEDVKVVKDRIVLGLKRYLHILHVIIKNKESSSVVLENRVRVDIHYQEESDKRMDFNIKIGNFYQTSLRFYKKSKKFVPSLKQISKQINQTIIKLQYNNLLAVDYGLHTAEMLLDYKQQKRTMPLYRYGLIHMFDFSHILDEKYFPIYETLSDEQQRLHHLDNVLSKLVVHLTPFTYGMYHLLKDYILKQCPSFVVLVPKIEDIIYIKVETRNFFKGLLDKDSYNNFYFYLTTLALQDTLVHFCRKFNLKYVFVSEVQTSNELLFAYHTEQIPSSKLKKVKITKDSPSKPISQDTIACLNILYSIDPTLTSRLFISDTKFGYARESHILSILPSKRFENHPYAQTLKSKWYLNAKDLYRWYKSYSQDRSTITKFKRRD